MHLTLNEPFNGGNRWTSVEYFTSFSENDGKIVVYCRVPGMGTSAIAWCESENEADEAIRSCHIWAIMDFLVKKSKEEGTYEKVMLEGDDDCLYVKQDRTIRIVSIEGCDGEFMVQKRNGTYWSDVNHGTFKWSKNLAETLMNKNRIHKEKMEGAK